MSRLVVLLTPRRVGLLILAVIAAYVGLHVVRDSNETTIVGNFRSADGLYKGDDVRVLGVRVGTITKIDPKGSGVKVSMKIYSGQPIPAEAHAAIVSPSLVSGRFVQLSPAYTGGAKLQDGASIAQARTAVPLSFDDVKRQLTDLATTLAPAKGGQQPLRQTIEALDANLRDGNADQLRQAVSGLRSAAGALSDGRSDLFDTVANLDSFTRNLAVNDAAVSGFTQELGSVSTVLSTNRTQLTAAIRALAQALATTGQFFTENRTRIRTSVKDLNLLSAALADRSNELAGVLHIAPTALIDLHNIIENQAITGRASLTGLQDATQLICGSILGAGGTAAQCQQALQPLLSLLNLPPNTPVAPPSQKLAKPSTKAADPQLLSGLTGLLPNLFGPAAGGAR